MLCYVQRLDSPDALVDFFGDVGAALSSNAGAMPPAGQERFGADVHSVLGTSLRCSLLAFDALPFEVGANFFGGGRNED